MGTELALMAAKLNLQANAERLMGLAIHDRKRLALRAITERDQQALWGLVLGHLVLHGRRGPKISAQTLRKYEQAFLSYWAWAEAAGVTLHRPPRDAGRAYIRSLETRGLKRSSVGWHLAACRALEEALRWSGLDEATTFRDVRPVPDNVPQHKKGKLYTPEQIEQLLEVADLEERLVVLLGADCGLRAGEILGVQRSGLFLDEDAPYIRFVGKGDKVREVALSRRAEQAVRDWLAYSPSFGPSLLFYTSVVYLEKLMRALCAKAGVPYLGRSVHGLRRTAGTRMYEETRDLLETRDFLGHSSSVTTEVYVKYALDRRRPKNRDW